MFLGPKFLEETDGMGNETGETKARKNCVYLVKFMKFMFFVFSFGFLYVLPFGYTELSDVVWHAIPKEIIWEIIFVVVFTTFIAYLFNSSALKYLTPATVSIYIYLQPVLATIIAIIFSSDTLDEINQVLSWIISESGSNAKKNIGVIIPAI